MALITVIGASGRQGLAQVRQALAAGYDVRAISRRPDALEGAPVEGVERVEVRSMDLYDTSTFAEALEGSDYIFYTHPLQARADRAYLIGEVGKAAAHIGVKRVVWNTSSWIPDKPGDPFTYGENTKGINALWRSGAPGTVFGSVLFMDNLLTNWARPFIVNEGRYVYPHNPNLEANWISLDDVARFMLASLERPDMEGAWLNIGGPERMVGKQVTQCLSEALGKAVLAHWPAREDGDECGIADGFGGSSWQIGLTREGPVFVPQLPHVIFACTEEVVLPWAEARPFLSAEGRAVMESLR